MCVIQTVNYVHSMQLVHADLKPGNIRVKCKKADEQKDEKDQYWPMLIDFDIARSMDAMDTMVATTSKTGE